MRPRSSWAASDGVATSSVAARAVASSSVTAASSLSRRTGVDSSKERGVTFASARVEPMRSGKALAFTKGRGTRGCKRVKGRLTRRGRRRAGEDDDDDDDTGEDDDDSLFGDSDDASTTVAKGETAGGAGPPDDVDVVGQSGRETTEVSSLPALRLSERQQLLRLTKEVLVKAGWTEALHFLNVLLQYRNDGTSQPDEPVPPPRRRAPTKNHRRSGASRRAVVFGKTKRSRIGTIGGR